MKALILAGGLGKRLSPITDIINKHLINIYDKPMIYYPLSIIMLSGIKEIGIICNKGDDKKFYNLLGDGSKLGLKITYLIQPKSDGICGGIKAAKNFIKGDSLFLMLGDNFFYGNELIFQIKKQIKLLKKCTIFSCSVKKFKNFGIIEYKKDGVINKIHEKPKKKYSGNGVTGMYLFDKSISSKIDKVKLSKRNEFEITDLLNKYVGLGLNETQLNRGVTWFDTGSFEDLVNASNFVKIIEEKQSEKIGCIEEIAYKEKLIDRKKFLWLIQQTRNPDLKKYLSRNK